MSGDVQPRKRREKKKKKEDGIEDVVFQHQHQTTTSPIVTDDLNIHIQKEASTGGGLCAKFVFFILLTALTTLIGLIITEHRGLTDLDAIDTESRFAQLFEGWIDAPSIDHESGEEPSIEQSEERAYEEEEEEDHDDEEEDDEQDQSLDHDDDEEDEEVSEEQATDENATDEENYEEEKEESELQDDTIENESEEVSNENDDENEDEVEEDEDEQEDEDEEEEQEYASEDEEISDGDLDASSVPTKEEITKEDEEESKEDKDEQEDSEEAVDKTAETEESPAESEETADLPDSEEEAADQTESEEIADRTESEEAVSLDDLDEVTTKKTDGEDTTPKRDVTSKTAKPDADSKETVTKLRQAKRAESEKKKTVEPSEDSDQPQEIDNYNKEKISTKKPQDGPEEAETVTPDLSRRNTIVTPPSLQEIEQDIENVEEEYSEDDENYDSEDDSRSKPTTAKMRYQELQSTYSHTLSPDWEPKEVRENRSKNYDEEDEEVEGDEDYDDEISENEDEELLKRLEAKYGIIRHSDEEPDDDDADDDENDDEEDDEEGELEEDRDDDFDTWKRVKVPSDNVPEDSDSENEKDWSKQGSGAQAFYDFENITNADDWKIREELDRAQQNLANDAAYALTLFNKILERNPSSPRAIYGKAQSLDILAEEKRSNDLLQQAIVSYQQVLNVRKVPDALFQMAAERCIDRMRFRGLYGQAVPIHKLLIQKFPEEAKFANHLAVTYLTTNKINEARKILYETLFKWPNDGFALVHYGFILKTNDNNLEGAIEFLKKGIETMEPGVIDGRFYFHLGDALTRLGRKEEAMTVYSDGVANKVFLSKYQRSLYNVERLTGKPWWKKEETPYVQFFEQLENNWNIIRDEGLSILNQKGYFQPESENLRDIGDWKQFELFARGIKNSRNCQQCPITCKIIETFPDAIGCRRGQIKFSVMHPGTHVWPHCGPTNCRLRSHLGLKVPSNTYIRVGEEIRSWEEGKLLIFDDSFEHEVWHNGTATRLVLIIDIWHPELTRREKQSLSSI